MELIKLFIDRCMETIIKAETGVQEVVITNLVRLLQIFFDSIDGAKYEDHDEDNQARRFTIMTSPKGCINLNHNNI